MDRALLKLKLPLPSRRLVGWIVLGLGILALLSWKVNSLPDGLSPTELETIRAIQQRSWLEPSFIVGLPYHLLLKVVLHFTDYSILAGRLLSLVLSTLGLIAFYRLAREWWSRLIAATATALLGSSLWFLIVSRLISPQASSLLWICGLILLFTHLKHESKWWHIMGCGFVAGLSLYMPPLLSWLSLAVTGTALIYSLRTNRGRLVSGWAVYFASFIVAIIPLGLAAAQDLGILRDIFGLQQINGLHGAINSAGQTSRALLWDGGPWRLLIPHIGLLDIATVCLALLGFLRTAVTWRLHRSQLLLLITLIGFGSLVWSYHQYAVFGYLLPIVYLFVARGLNQYYSEWRQRFPRNQTAKLAGVLAVVSLVVLIGTYNVRGYYVAWARNGQVQSQFEETLLQ